MEYEIKDLDIEELVQGYFRTEGLNQYTCIFCGETFDEGIIYNSEGRLLSAERAVYEHVISEHGGSFKMLIELDKSINGLSEVHKNILNSMYDEKSNKQIGEELNINVATVRTHKFNIQRMKKEAKILLALLEQIENEDIVARRKNTEAISCEKAKQIDIEQNSEIGSVLTTKKLNNLHPFFTYCNFR